MVDLILIRSNDMKAVYGDTSRFVACEPPYWAGVIAAYAKKSGIDVEIVDAEACNYSPEETAAAVNNLNPKMVGLIVTGSNLSASTQKMQGAGAVCAEIKKISPEMPIFMWGLHPSALPKRTLEEEQIDYVIKGEGLSSIVQLTKYIKKERKKGRKELFGIKGLHYMQGSKIIANEELNLEDIENVPSPAWELLPMDKYLPHNWQLFGEDKEDARGKYAVLATSLGCPYSCTFCAISSLFGTKKVRFISVDKVMDEIDTLVNEYGVKYIKMQDECFVLRADYINELCDRLIERDYDLNIWGYARIDTVTEELLYKLRRANVRWLAFGVESGSIDSLNGVAKGQFDNEKVKRVVKMTQDAGIYVLTDFMFGLPDDDINAMEKSLELCKDINPEWINFYSTMPYPGSQLYKQYVESGEPLASEWIAYAQYSYECTPKGSKYLTPAEVLKYRDYAFNAFFENNDRYFSNIEKKFGQQTVEEIKEMTKVKLRRKLLEQ